MVLDSRGSRVRPIIAVQWPVVLNAQHTTCCNDKLNTVMLSRRRLYGYGCPSSSVLGCLATAKVTGLSTPCCLLVLHDTLCGDHLSPFVVVWFGFGSSRHDLNDD